MVDIDVSVPIENQDNKQYEDFRVATHYSVEDDVYSATGLTSLFLQTLGKLSGAEITTLVNGYIAKADERIRRWMGIPITVRKEGHEFFNNPIIELGPDREDPFEMFGSYNPENKAVEVYAIYYNEYRTKIPYPKDWDMFTEPSAVGLWGVDNGIVGGTTTAITGDTTNFKCGTGSLKVVVSRVTGGNSIAPNPTIKLWYRIPDSRAVSAVGAKDR